MPDHQEPSPMQAAPMLRSIRFEGGSIAFRESEANDLPALVYLHSLGSNALEFRSLFPLLGEYFRIVAWDAPGFGGSAGLRDEIGFAAALKQLLGALGIDRAHIVGSSLGTVVASHFADQHPEYVRSLTLLAPPLGFGALAEESRVPMLAGWLDPGAFLLRPPAELAGMLCSPDSPQAARDHVMTLGDFVTIEGYRAGVRLLFDTHMPALLGRISAPTLIVAGARDMVAPPAESAELIRDASVDCVYQVMEGAGHILAAEQPQKLAAILVEFLKRH
ncbi:alpha/beta fold hydrolase [Sphingomonas sp. SRS2]|uniref:alpha/beta fold hydrolase n=1 Tax=Sphingomonas sp. SRS2 TaxID=133190 RepID=UPI0006975464|nr:alpha/beta hydrolase [Sphingomonas sp. SRS2]